MPSEPPAAPARQRVEPLGAFYPDAGDPRQPADVAVVMPTVIRPVIAEALRSIYAQTLAGRIQVVIGIDVARGDPAPMRAAIAERPDHVSVIVLRLPFSTSVRHGGVHLALDGGALRSILSLSANARRVAYLDDDNVYLPEHLERLSRAMEGRAWAGSRRMMIDEDTGEELGVDIWDSVGPNRGRFAAGGGFVDTNCLLVDKVRLSDALSRWSSGGSDKPSFEADKNFFRAIAPAPHALVEEASVLYKVRRNNVLYRFASSRRPSFEELPDSGAGGGR